MIEKTADESRLKRECGPEPTEEGMAKPSTAPDLSPRQEDGCNGENGSRPPVGKPLFTDVRYKAPFSGKLLQVMAYAILIFSHFYLMFVFAQEVIVAENVPGWAFAMLQFSDVIKGAALPLILLAAFNTIMNRSRDVRLFAIRYVICSLVLFLLYILIFYRYLVGTVSLFFDLPAKEVAAEVFDFLIASVPKFMNYNVFVDLANCSLFFFFISYTPKRQNKKLLVFIRSLSVLPILAVVGCCVFNYTVAFWEIAYPPEILFILPCRSPSMHLIFFALALFIKYRYALVARFKGEEYCDLYKGSNKDNLTFSVFCALTIIAVSLIDFLFSFSPIMCAMGFGDSYAVAIVAPLTLLFSYNKPIRSSSLDILIPLLSIGIIAFIYIEGVFMMFSSIFSM